MDSLVGEREGVGKKITSLTKHFVEFKRKEEIEVIEVAERINDLQTLLLGKYAAA